MDKIDIEMNTMLACLERDERIQQLETNLALARGRAAQCEVWMRMNYEGAMKHRRRFVRSMWLNAILAMLVAGAVLYSRLGAY